jgi:predicted HTH domain antitoxin
MLDENDTAIYLISKDAFKNLDYSDCHIRNMDLSIRKKYISIIEYGTYVEKIKTDEKSYERKLRDDKFQVTYIDYEENELPNITLPKHIASINFKCTKFPKNLSIAYINHTDISDEIFMHIKGEINIRKYDVTLPLNIHNHNNVVILYNSGISFSKISTLLKVKRDNVKNILKEKNVWIEDRDGHQVIFLFSGDFVNQDLYQQETIKIQEVDYDAPDAYWIYCQDVIDGKVILYPEFDYKKLLSQLTK